jgi:hypothetical protein
MDRSETLRYTGGRQLRPGKAVQELAQILDRNPALRRYPEPSFTLAFPLAPYRRLTIECLDDPPTESVDPVRVAEAPDRRALHVLEKQTADGVHALGVEHGRLLRN